MYKEEYEKPKMNITKFKTEDVVDIIETSNEAPAIPGIGTEDPNL